MSASTLRWLLGLSLVVTRSAVASWAYQESVAPADLAVRFGQAVAADVRSDGSVRAVYVGAPNATVHDANGDHPAAGKVYVLTPTGGWHVAATLTPVGTPYSVQDYAHFGTAVAVHAGVVVVGAPEYDFQGVHHDGGSVTVYEDTTRDDPGNPEPVLHPYASGQLVLQGDDTHLGASVAINGASLDEGIWMATGAPDDAGTGCVRVFRLVRPSAEYGGIACGSAGSKLGSSLAIHALSQTGYVIVAGAPAVTQGDQALAGEAYVYVPIDDTITKLDTLKAPNPVTLDAFGTAVALDATHIYVGGTGRWKSGVGRTGSVSIFEPTGIIGYSFDVEIFPGSGASVGDLCGASLSARHEVDGFVAMGCPSHDGLVANEGVVRVLTLGSLLGNPFWFQDRLDMSDLPHGADDLGRSVALVGDHVYAGAPMHDDAFAADNGILRVFATDRIFRDGFQ